MSIALGLAQCVPMLNRFLSSSQGDSIASHVVEMARALTGENEVNRILHKLQADPSLMINFQKAILTKEVDWEKALLKDRESARSRDMVWVHSGKRNIRADVMVLSAAGGLVFCLVSLAYYAEHLPGEAVGIISTVAGIFGSCLKDAYAFEFGSSRGSREKDATVTSLLERGPS